MFHVPETGLTTRLRVVRLCSAAMAASCDLGVPIRVMRGVPDRDSYTKKRYTYDGLYMVWLFAQVYQCTLLHPQGIHIRWPLHGGLLHLLTNARSCM